MIDFAVRMVNLPGAIRGAVRMSDDGFMNIYINDNLSPEAKQATLEHELNHIKRDDFYNGKPIEDVEKNEHRKGYQF